MQTKRPTFLLMAALFAAALAASFPSALEATAVREETFAIAAGWNLIHIAGDPITPEVNDAFAAIAWTSVWAWVPPARGESQGRWVVQHRNQPAFLSSLRALVGSTSYALLATSPGVLRLKTCVVPRHHALRGGTFQLFGPSVPITNPPTASAYFVRPGVKEHVTAVYEFAAGVYRRVTDALPLRAGAAYWVFSTSDVAEPDPIRVRTGLGGLRFNSQVTLAEIEIDVGVSSQARPLIVRALPSADGQSRADWLQIQPASSFQGQGGGAGGGGAVSIELPSDETRVRLSLSAETAGVVPPGSLDQGVVVEIVLPNGLVVLSAELSPPLRQGIWIGEATLTEVQRPGFAGGGYAPAPALPFALLLEITANGDSRLLPCVEVQAHRDGLKRTYRLEAGIFLAPLDLAGTLAGDGSSGELTGSTHLPATDPLNPYRHRYHPEHGVGFDVTRSITLKFGEEGPALPAGANPLATVGILGGVYEEEISGLAQERIRVRGTFRLRQIAGGTAVPCGTAR